MKKSATYEHEVEKPAMPSEGRMERGMGCMEFKGEADPIAFGQAAAEGCRSDYKKISGQMKDYHWS